MTNNQKSFEELAEIAYQETDKQFEKELDVLLAATGKDLEKLRPATTDPIQYEQMIAVVQESIRLNEERAQLMERLKKKGNGVFNLGISTARMISGL